MVTSVMCNTEKHRKKKIIPPTNPTSNVRIMRGLFSHDTDIDNFIPFIRYVPNVNAMSVEHFSRFARMVHSLSSTVCCQAKYFGPSDLYRAENSVGFRICHDRRLGIMILLLSPSPARDHAMGAA